MTSTNEPRDLPRPAVITVVVATTIAQLAAVMGFAVFPVIAPRPALDLDVPASTVGYQLSLAYGTAALATSFLSGMIPRYGACRVTQAGLALCAAGMLLATTAGITAIAAASILLGLGMSVMTPASTHLLFRFSPAQNRNLIFSIKQTGVPLGWFVIALTAPWITSAFGWRWALGMVALATLVWLQPKRAQWGRRHSAGDGAQPLVVRGPGNALERAVFTLAGNRVVLLFVRATVSRQLSCHHAGRRNRILPDWSCR